MPPERYTPTQAARHASVSPNTVRQWAKEYREFFSEYANPATGESRAFTPGDVAILQAIAQLRINGLSHEDVKQRLRQQPPPALQDATGVPESRVEASTSLAVPTDAIQTFLAHSGAKLDDVAGQLEKVDRRLERVESQRTLIWVALAGVALGAGLVSVIVWLVLSVMR